MPAGAAPADTAPPAIRDLAQACVRFVERSVGVKLDYEPETLPLLDYYLEQARASAGEQSETLAVVVQAAGAYFGEVVRRRYASWWHVEGEDPARWQIQFERVYLAIHPMQLMADALSRVDTQPDALDGNDEGRDEAGLELTEEDRALVAARLADIPPVTEREFYAPSTRLEVIEIALEAILARRMAEGEETQARLSPDDYDT
jgi:hypothetical protein